jgi:predicted nucleotide-binding protein (sugar kinase/HSP70/actin superfamily)
MRPGFKVREWKLEELRNRKIWIPHMCDSAFILAAVMRSLGYDSDVLPRSKDSGFSLGRKYTNGDQCLPSIVTTEDILQRVFSPDFKQGREAFFQGKSEGPCRFGRYYMNQQAILHDLEVDAPIFTLDNRDAYSGMGSDAKIRTWDGMIALSLLERSLHFTRPFELVQGTSEGIYDRYLKGISRVIEKRIPGTRMGKRARILANTHKNELVQMIDFGVQEFTEVRRRTEYKPVVFLTGEIYVRASSVANQNLVERIEKLGGVVLLEPVTSFFDYINEFKLREAREERDRKKLLKTQIDVRMMRRDERDISHLFSQLLGDFCHDASASEVIAIGRNYVHEAYKGEAIVTLGASEYFASRVQGIVNVLPFNCMPGTIVSSKTAELRARNNDIPFLNLSYDGHQDPVKDEQLGVFMYQIMERMRS